MITEKERDTLNLIRWISTISIVSCHLLQGYDNIYAWIFNVGVQVFFFLSGFLYGNKRITNTLSFYRKRIVKLYLPYAIWVIIAACFLNFSSEANSINVTAILKQLVMLKNLPGLNHLWFMRVIFLCYLILPLIDLCLTSKKFFIIVVLGLLLSLMMIFNYTATLLWIVTYYAGYLCGRYPKIQSFLGIISFIMVLCLIKRTYLTLTYFKEPSIQNDLLHTFGGIFIFLLIYKTVRHLRFGNNIRQLLNKRGGYEIYLTHHIFIIGPLSLLSVTPFSIFNILIVIIITLLSSYWLTKISQILQNTNACRTKHTT